VRLWGKLNCGDKDPPWELLPASYEALLDNPTSNKFWGRTIKAATHHAKVRCLRELSVSGPIQIKIGPFVFDLVVVNRRIIGCNAKAEDLRRQPSD
jgi:hypothetical protein